MSYGAPQGKFAKRQGIEKDRYVGMEMPDIIYTDLCYYCGQWLKEIEDGIFICQVCDLGER
jgi:ribosomal protein L37AE/L43A